MAATRVLSFSCWPRPALPERQVWRVPPRIRMFTGRVGVVDRLRTVLDGGGIAVVHGIGGVGKTTVASEYVHRHAAAAEVVWWVDATVPERVPAQLHDLAVARGLTGPESDVTTGSAAALEWMRRSAAWLLVVDNAGAPHALRSVLPEGPGRILVTSRDSRWSEVADRAERLDVFSPVESLALLRNRFPHLDPGPAHRLAERLGHLPLGLTQAIGFIGESGCGVGEYLKRLDEQAGPLLTEGRPPDYADTLAETVQLAVARVEQESPGAAELLRVAAFLGPAPVSAGWFGPRLEVRRSLALLSRYGLVGLVDGEVQLHRLTAAVVRESPAAGEYRRAAERLLVAARPGPPGQVASWPGWGRITVHLLASAPEDSDDPAFRALALDAVWVAATRGEYGTSVSLAQRLFEAWSTRLEEGHPHTLEAGQRLAMALAESGASIRARRVSEGVLSVSRRIHGDDHEFTLVAANNTASCLFLTGDVLGARRLDESIWARFRDLLGADHPRTLCAASNLADDFRALGDAAAARELDQDTLGRRRRELGPDHPYTLVSASNLAADLRALARFEAARDLDREVLELRRHLLGEDHAETLFSVAALEADLRGLAS